MDQADIRQSYTEISAAFNHFQSILAPSLVPGQHEAFRVGQISLNNPSALIMVSSPKDISHSLFLDMKDGNYRVADLDGKTAEQEDWEEITDPETKITYCRVCFGIDKEGLSVIGTEKKLKDEGIEYDGSFIVSKPPEDGGIPQLYLGHRRYEAGENKPFAGGLRYGEIQDEKMQTSVDTLKGIRQLETELLESLDSAASAYKFTAAFVLATTLVGYSIPTVLQEFPHQFVQIMGNLGVSSEYLLKVLSLRDLFALSSTMVTGSLIGGAGAGLEILRYTRQLSQRLNQRLTDLL